MSKCECLPTCPFFHDQMKGLEAIKNMMKQRLCLGDNSDCARYRVFSALGRNSVPKDLIPNDLARAEKIIANG